MPTSSKINRLFEKNRGIAHVLPYLSSLHFFNQFKIISALPVPIATQSSGSSAINTGIFVSSEMTLSRF